jgi:hypothetical protein
MLFEYNEYMYAIYRPVSSLVFIGSGKEEK